VSERDALLAAIRANPEDDTPRLAFADWLDEYEPDAKSRRKKGAAPSSWAALIRAECEFERLRNSGSAAAAVYAFFDDEDRNAFDGVRWERVIPEVSRLVELHQLIPKLRKESAKARKAGLPKAKDIGAGWSEDTHRGFPGGVWVHDLRKFVRNFGAVAAAAPPGRVIFPLYEELPAELASPEVLAWCREAHMSANHAEFVRALSAEPAAAGVRMFVCERSTGASDDEIAASLADSPHWSGLRELTFGYGTGLSAAVAGRLFRAEHLRRLVRVRAVSNRWTADALTGLDNFTNLRELWLMNSGLVDAAAERLAEMPGLANLRLLNLKNNRVTGRGATALLTSRHLKSLTVLHLEGNPVRNLDRRALADAPAGGLRALNLQSARLTVADLVAVVSSPRAAELLYFAGCRNNFPESAVARMVKAFRGRAPAILYYMDNNVSTAGAQALAKWPAADRIDMLHLSDNRLSVTGARAIAGCPHLRQLNHICAGAAREAARTVLVECFGDRADV
jgi:uncharacterized protein (TIGR02996 family)